MGDVPLDELQWNNPAAVAFYGGINAENVHLYFLVSDFCEITSNNKILENQSKYNQGVFEDLKDRTRFEARLERMNGVEYRIVEGPSKTTPGPEFNPVWVFRKQNRIKQAGQEDRLTILGTYFAIGENIYQAPSLQDIIRCRLMSVTNLLSRFYETAASMQHYAPAQGHSYLAPLATSTARSGLESTRTSRATTPIADNASQLSQQAPKDTPQVNDDGAIYESFSLSMNYGGEFMDENPLIGEPGSFVLASTGRNLKDQREKKEIAAEAAKNARTAVSSQASAAPTPPNPIKVTDPPRKSSASSKAKSPISPVDGGVKKRRKSKAPGTPGISPTSPS